MKSPFKLDFTCPIDFKVQDERDASGMLGQPIYQVLKLIEGKDWSGVIRIKNINALSEEITLEWYGA